jgi:FkbM family methyltransferase
VFKSYGQNGEDVVLARTFWDLAVGFYIDVGAWDPVVHSVTKSFYDRGWHGLNIEPQPDRLLQLQQTRPRDINLGIAVSDTAGIAQLIVPRESALATLDRAVINASQADYAIAAVHDVETQTMSAVIDQHCPKADIAFLKIDVEGHEASVLRGLDLRRHRPVVIIVEATIPTTMTPNWAPWEWLLLSSGYNFQLFDGLNRFYLRVDRMDLAPRVSLPTNIFDNFMSPRERLLHEKIAALEAKLAASDR